MEPFFELDACYHRDVYFVYSEQNEQPYIDSFTKPLNGVTPLYYEVDVLDEAITQYDILPTIGLPLVSSLFVEQFRAVSDKEVQFIPAQIRDNSGDINHQFYAMKVLKRFACIDMNRSQVSYRRYGECQSLQIQTLVIDASKVEGTSIFSLQEKLAYIIVNQTIRDLCQPLRGVECLPLDEAFGSRFW
ncbi:DUF1629 domain-containing protein [Shewanella sp.]|uniref:imm11 family protein n=1 Tax=Shewanella sp. TaxID=50422 RepID=UPI00260EC2AA|nr:DUF1629 domain-containing protein [Shewanella sp.]